jgi:hypothetical protein
MKLNIKEQSGMVLWITLVILFVMLVSAVGLIRTSDTAVQTAGNFAFRQGGVSSSDFGSQESRQWLITKMDGGVDAFGCGTLDNDCAAAGYSASFAQPATNQTWEAFWTANQGLSRNVGTDAAGNTIRVWIQRMCASTGNWQSAGNSCITQSLASGTGEGGKSVGVTAVDATNVVLHYSILVKIDGPRGASTLVQTVLQGPAGS